MRCPTCGHDVPRGAGYCPRCHSLLPGASVRRGTRPVGLLVVGIAAVLVVVAGVALGTGLAHRAASNPSATPPAQLPASTAPASVPPTSTARTPRSTAPSRSATTFAALFPQVRSGVVQVVSTRCDGSVTGTGFLVSPNSIATVAHVVDGAVTVKIRTPRGDVPGTVVGIDRSAELAVIRVSPAIDGHVFRLAATDPGQGSEIAEIGYPQQDISITAGTLSGLGRTASVEGRQLAGLLQYTAATNPGNSGGPLLTLDGTVVGLAEASYRSQQNVNLAVSAARSAGELLSWTHQSGPVDLQPPCSPPPAPAHPDVGVVAHASEAEGIAATLQEYVAGVNVGDFARAYAVLGRKEHEHMTLAVFSRGLNGTTFHGVTLQDVRTTSAGADAVVSFTTHHPADARTGQTCDLWRLTYQMVRGGSGWLIDWVPPALGYPQPCT